MNMKKILITGGAGFLGSSLANKLLEKKGVFVVIADNLSTGTTGNISKLSKSRLEFVNCDANDYQDISEVFSAHQFDYVFHYAAVVGVKRTLAHPLEVLKDVEGIQNVLSLAKNTGVKRVFYSSSSEVYGEPVVMPQNEKTTPLNARLPYAVVKNMGEVYFKAYKQEFGLDYTILRFFNTYGSHQSKDFVVSKFIELSLAGKDITVYDDGKQSRTFCYVDDNAEATYNALFENKFVNDTVNIGSDSETSILELAELVIKLTKSKSKIIHLPPLKEGDMTRRQPDIAKMMTLVDRPLTSLEVGLKKTIKDFK